MDKIEITSAKYLKDGISDENSSIKVIIDGQELFVPLGEGNRHYDEIMRQVEAGELTIEEAD
jgi:hypothetical protein